MKSVSTCTCNNVHESYFWLRLVVMATVSISVSMEPVAVTTSSLNFVTHCVYYGACVKKEEEED